MAEYFDVIISGASYAGTSLAYALSSLGLKVALIDRGEIKVAADAPSRLFAIAQATCDIYEKLGLTINFPEIGGPIAQIRVVDGYSSLDFFPEDIELDQFGYMVEESSLLEKLKSNSATQEKVSIKHSQSIAEISYSALIGVKLENGEKLKASLLIGADGKYSIVKKLSGIADNTYDYNASGIVCDIKHEYPHNNIATEKFLPSGPFALLPKKDPNVCSIVWSDKSGVAECVKHLDKEIAESIIAERFGDHLGKIELASKIQSFPLQLVKPKSIVSDRIALVGDAAHSIHPIAGQGLNLGMRDVYALFSLVAEYTNLGLDIGSRKLLKEYSDNRKADVSLMVNATHYLNQLFTLNFIPITFARRLGINLVDKTPLLKRLFTTYAVGDIEALNL